MNRKEQEELYKQTLSEVLDVLEGGDIALDFTELPSAVTTIRIIADIAGKALKNITETRKMLDALEKRFNVVYNSREWHLENKEATK